MPEFSISFFALAIAVIAAFLIGFAWYTFLFPRRWAQEMGFDPDERPQFGEMLRGIALNVLGNCLLVWVFAHNLAVWDPQTWGLAASGASNLQHAFMGAFFTWLGFFVPVSLTAVAWERKSWTLFAINAGYHFVSLLVVAIILTGF